MNIRSYIQEFGLMTFLVCSSTRVARKLHLSNRLMNRLEDCKYDYLVRWIGENVHPSDAVKNQTTRSTLTRADPIYVFWWQGIDNSPKLVKACIDSIYRNAGKHPVVLLDSRNVSQYVSLPSKIINMVDKGEISITHFSDLVRFALMSQSGGFWLDATIYLTDEIPDIAYSMPYFSLNGTFDRWPWTDFLQGSVERDLFTSRVCNYLIAFNLQYSQLITYLLVDTCMRYVYENSSEARLEVDSIPNVDKSIFVLNDRLLDSTFSENEWRELKQRTFCHKLSYKFAHEERTGEGLTYFGKLVQEGRLP